MCGSSTAGLPVMPDGYRAYAEELVAHGADVILAADNTSLRGASKRRLAPCRLCSRRSPIR